MLQQQTNQIRRQPSNLQNTRFSHNSLGVTSRPWNSQHWNGSTGSTIAAYWNPSATFRPPRPNTTSTQCWTNKKWPHNLNQTASGKPGAVHNGRWNCHHSNRSSESGSSHLAHHPAPTGARSSFKRNLQQIGLGQLAQCLRDDCRIGTVTGIYNII